MLIFTGSVEKADSVTSKGEKVFAAVIGQDLQFTSPQTSLSLPVARLPPPVETFVAPPTTIGPYANTPYFVSRTIPFVRAYPHMGVPFFACPLPGTGDSNPMPTPYGQFVPMVPATVGQEKYIGQTENESAQKNRGISDRQFNRRNKKKLSNSEYSFESENPAEVCRETVTAEEHTPVSSPVSTTVNSDRPTSVPIVPLPVPPSTFGVASGTLPIHGYPPGLHTLPYTPQMSGPQAPSAAMYYVPVFNHPYGSYLPSPPSAPMVLPVNIRPENESAEVSEDCSEEVLKNVILPTSVTKPVMENTPNVQSNSEVNPISEQYIKNFDAKQDPVDPTAKNMLSEVEEVIDCKSASDKSLDKSVNSSSDNISEKVIINEDRYKCQPADEESKDASRDASRCWADLFKKPCSEVNGIDRPLAAESTFESLNNLGKEVSNGKLFSVPASDNIL